ncbi:MAG: hypothetical protein J6S15_00835 [Clostridia bacterium]|nr:hypothetical protein [Clostridia bacterium]
MKRSLRILCLAMALLLCGGLLAACSDGPTESGAESSADNTSGTTSESLAGEFTDEKGNYIASLSGNTYGGQTITFLICSVNETYNSELVYNDYANPGPTTSNEQIAEVVNKAYKDRNELVEEQLGITIAEEFVHDPGRKNSKMVQRITQDNLVFMATYQVVVPCLYDGANLAKVGALMNLYDLPDIQMTAPWWDQVFQEEVTIAGQLYFTIGDIGTVNKSAAAALTFNKSMYEENGLAEKFGGSIYDLVREGKWTIDVALEMTREFGEDLNDDGLIDYNDLVGWSGQLDDMWSLFYGSGSKLASTDTADGYPVLTAYTQRSAAVMEKMQTLVQDDQHYLSANDYFSVVPWPSVLLRDNFIAGNSLFYNGSMTTPMELGGMDDDFGLVPIPKGDEEQETYYSLVNPWVSTCFAVPISLAESDYLMISDFLNAMGAASANIVAPAYIEQCLEDMKSRDDDTIEMIEDYILPGRGCDIGMIFAWGGLDALLQTMASQPVGTFSSQYEAKESAAQAALEETVNFFKDPTK